MLFVNDFRRATSPPVTIASITNNPVCQGRLGLVRCFPKHNVNRVVFDTRSLFGDDTLVDEATLEAKRAKPKVPTHVIRTGHHPFIRVIVPMDRALGAWVLEQWVNKVLQWIEQGVVPYIFFHTPDNATAPQLAVKFNRMLHQQNPEVALLCDWAEDDRQTALF